MFKPHNYTESEKQNLRNWIKVSFLRLIERDGDLLDPKKVEKGYKIEGQKEFEERQLHEITINHRLACHLEYTAGKFGFDDYYCDIEYNRYINQRKKVQSIETGKYIDEVRPDVIIHKRTNLDAEIPHLLVIEAKKKSNNEKDINHVKDIMWDDNYKYKFGLLVSYFENEETINCVLLTLENGNFIPDDLKYNKNRMSALGERCL